MPSEKMETFLAETLLCSDVQLNDDKELGGAIPCGYCHECRTKAFIRAFQAYWSAHQGDAWTVNILRSKMLVANVNALLERKEC